MNFDYDIEYVLVGGEPVFDSARLVGDVQVLRVMFDAEPTWCNDGIGSYEFWGQKCFDAGTDYVSLEENGDPSWDVSSYTDEENRVIEAFKRDEKRWEDLCEMICEEYQSQSA